MAYLTPYFGVGTHTGQVCDILEAGAVTGIGGYNYFVPIYAVFQGKYNANGLPIMLMLKVLDNNPASPSGPAAISGQIGLDKFFDLAATYVVVNPVTIEFRFNMGGNLVKMQVSPTGAGNASTKFDFSGGLSHEFVMQPK